MTKEQYLNINANELRALAKSRGVKKTSAMKKGELVEKMLELDRLEAASGMSGAAADGTEEKRTQPESSRAEQSQSESSRAEQSQSERTQGERVRPEKAQAGRPQPGQSQVERSRTERVQSEKARVERVRPEKTQSDRFQNDRSQNDRSQIERPRSDRSQTEYVLRKQAEFRETASEELAPVRDVQEGRAPQRQERQDQTQSGQNQSGQNQSGQNQTKEDRHFRENGGRRGSGESAERSSSQDYAARNNASAQSSGNEEESSGGSAYVPGRIPGDTGKQAHGILEVMQDGFGFLRSENFLPGEDDVYVSPSQIRRFNLKTGDMITGNKRDKAQGEKYGALLYVSKVNGRPADEARNRCMFEHMTPVFPDERIRLERPDGSRATRIVDLISPRSARAREA